jgi:hypothetical protein
MASLVSSITVVIDKISMPGKGDMACVHCSVYAMTQAQHDRIR